MNLVLLGAPGAGKGTQAKKLEDEYGLAHISTGDLLRAAVAAQSELGVKAKSYMDAGQLVPDDLVIGLVKERLAQDDAQKGFILDGFPRTTAQAQELATQLEAMGIALDAALLVEVAPEVIIKRLSSRRTCPSCGFTAGEETKTCPRCGATMYQRDDDNPEAVATRLTAYENQTKPLIEYYTSHGLLREVDGDRPVDVVYASVKDTLGL